MRLSCSSFPRRRFPFRVPAWVGMLLLVVSSAAITGCGSLSIPGLGAGSFDLGIAGEQPEKIKSLFVIVGDEGDLAESDAPGTIANLVRPDRHRKYRTFAQFKPIANEAGDGWLWDTKNIAPQHPEIEFLPSLEALQLDVAFGRKVFDTHPQSCLVVLVHYGGKDWKAEKLLGPELENSKQLQIEVRDREMVRKAEQ